MLCTLYLTSVNRYVIGVQYWKENGSCLKNYSEVISSRICIEFSSVSSLSAINESSCSSGTRTKRFRTRSNFMKNLISSLQLSIEEIIFHSAERNLLTDLESEKVSGRTRSEDATTNLPCHRGSTTMNRPTAFVFTFYVGIIFGLLSFVILSSRIDPTGMDSYTMLGLPTTTQAKKNLVSESANTVRGQCPLAVRKNVGLFDKSKRHNGDDLDNNFRDVILLVSCNYAYYNLLQNWEYLANELDLKWAVLALDEDLYEELGPKRAVPPGDDASVSGQQMYRRGNFNKLSCNKLKLVLEIAKNCDVDIVFSDVDNIFYKNPFEHDLGRLIRSKRYDYIYQSNREPTGGTPGTDRCLWGFPRLEGNTGFYYFSRKSKVLKEIYEATIQSCDDPDNKLDDQALFWREFWKKESDTTTTFDHCQYDEYLEPTKRNNLESAQQSGSSFGVCCMDPYYYPTGDHAKITGPHNKDPVTYHANQAHGYEKKIKKLIDSRWDHYGWDSSRTIDRRGGLLGKRAATKKYYFF